MLTRRQFISGLAALPLAASLAKAEITTEIPADKFSVFSKRLRPIGRILELEGYYVWCNAPIEGPHGKIHVFFSRWSAEKRMGGWINASEIAHAVADQPEGPHTVRGTVLAPRGPGVLGCDHLPQSAH